MYNLLYLIYESFIKIRIFGLNEFPYKIVFEYFYESVYDAYYNTIFCFESKGDQNNYRRFWKNLMYVF